MPFLTFLAVLFVMLSDPALAFQLQDPKETDHDLPVGVQFIDLAGSADWERRQVKDLFNPLAGLPGTWGAPSYLAGYQPAWEQCPTTRIQFDTAEPNAGFFGRYIAKAAGAVLASIANMVFLIPVTMVIDGIELLHFAFHSSWAASLAGGLAEALKGIWGGLTPLVVFLPAVLMLLLLRKAVKVELLGILRALIVSVLSLGAALFLFLGTVETADGPKPAVEVVVGGVCKAADDLAAAVLSAFGSVSNTTLSGDDLKDRIQSPADRALNDFCSFVYRAMVMPTWSVIEFGTANPKDLHMTEAEFKAVQGRDEFKVKTESGKEYDPFGKEIKPGARIDVLMLAYPPGHPAREALANALADNSIDHGGHPMTPITLSASGKIPAWVMSVFFLFSAGAFLLFCIFMAVPMVLAQVAIVLLFLLSPFVLLAAAFVPEGGLLFGERYLKQLLSALGTKVFYGVYVSLVVVAANLLFRMAAGSSTSPLVAVGATAGKVALIHLLLVFLFVGAIWFRRKLFEQMQTAVLRGQAVLQHRLARMGSVTEAAEASFGRVEDAVVRRPVRRVWERGREAGKGLLLRLVTGRPSGDGPGPGGDRGLSGSATSSTPETGAVPRFRRPLSSLETGVEKGGIGAKGAVPLPEAGVEEGGPDVREAVREAGRRVGAARTPLAPATAGASSPAPEGSPGQVQGQPSGPGGVGQPSAAAGGLPAQARVRREVSPPAGGQEPGEQGTLPVPRREQGGPSGFGDGTAELPPVAARGLPAHGKEASPSGGREQLPAPEGAEGAPPAAPAGPARQQDPDRGRQLVVRGAAPAAGSRGQAQPPVPESAEGTFPAAPVRPVRQQQVSPPTTYAGSEPVAGARRVPEEVQEVRQGQVSLPAAHAGDEPAAGRCEVSGEAPETQHAPMRGQPPAPPAPQREGGPVPPGGAVAGQR
ncbi:hypothetical protein DXX99_08725, partial [Ammonifex thiophilus]